VGGGRRVVGGDEGDQTSLPGAELQKVLPFMETRRIRRLPPFTLIQGNEDKSFK